MKINLVDRLCVVYPGEEAYTLQKGVELLPLPAARERVEILAGRRLSRRPSTANICM